MLRRFPFSIVYCVVDDVIRIVAIAHAKLRPGYWRSRCETSLTVSSTWLIPAPRP